MDLENLVGIFVRRLNRHLFELPGPPEPVALPTPAPERNYLLYLHIPFCPSLCPFCSFHRVRFHAGPANAYFDSLEQEIGLASDRGYRFDEMYIGGGTPTVLPDRLLGIIAQARGRHPLTAISIETNPNDLAHPELRRLADAGVSRLSVGVQSFDDALLRDMNRYDAYGSSVDIRHSLERTRGVFDVVNVDMIFNLPRQSEASLDQDLDILVNELGVDQVSFYPLMAAGDARLSLERAMGPVNYERERQLYELIAHRMQAAGYTRNSAWCFSRKPGMFDEYIVNREEYVGLGSGAFSFLSGALYSSTFDNMQYAELVAGGHTATVFRKSLGDHEQMRYYLLMQLFGGSVSLAAAERRFGGHFENGLWRELSGLRLMGAIRTEGDRIRLTERGYYLWVVLMREFFSSINSLRYNMRHLRLPVSRAVGAGETGDG
jgi:coproporphyrinogen III oxidase-like Fe-S oxidoreductase